ncbi:hypothetical protein PF008_g24261 [Phytophthora fragariae]|uniref:GAF domain-containing protein n=1 Tax=Phytophthora fragariae TaxID=53985 RepID=A0A6G0QNB8_9STRA|nr:hypothetical protein PF008_g24261 [Phytophthora fragariae]
MAEDTEVAAAATIEAKEDGATQATASGITKSNGESEVRRLSVDPLLKRRSSSSLGTVADMDLVELSLLDVLTQAATDILASIPAQRCIVYIYDKAAHLLRPQVVVDCNDKDPDDGEAAQEDKPTEDIATSTENAVETKAESDTNSSDIGSESDDVAKTPLVSFPPVVGMVSSCFLQRRCLRMQEPNPHRAFHREYDAPKDMQVDSILCAPIILYHRATAVIQLLNRLDTTGERAFEEAERAATPQDHYNESSSEVRLRRLKTVKVIVKTGFSTKDEQKLLHFTTHIAQSIEINTKKLANGRNHAKIREVKARKALDLLNSLNGNIVARVNSTEMVLPANVEEHTGRSFHMRRATITRMPSQKGVLTDMLSALVVIMRLQAIFRGRRQRRHDKFTEELEKFRKQRELMRTMIVMQRIARSPEESIPKVKPNINRVKGGSSRSRIRPEKPPRSPSKPPTPTTPRRPAEQPVTPQPTRIQRRKTSAISIQRVFRQHQERRQTVSPSPRIPTPAKIVGEKLAKETVSAVKVQSFVRGNLVRKRLQKALLEPKGPRIICLRIASTSTESVSNQNSHENARPSKLRSQTCVYAMPERPSKHHRGRVFRDTFDDTSDESQISTHNQGVAVAARRLVANHKTDGNERVVKSPTRRSKPRWGRLVSTVIWETSPNPEHELSPPGVEFVKHSRSNADSPSTYRQGDKVSSPRTTSTATALPISKDNGSSVKLPALTSRLQCDIAKPSLLCCLLPSQTKRLTSEIAPLAVRPIAPIGRKTFETIRRTQKRSSPIDAAPDAMA